MSIPATSCFWANHQSYILHFPLVNIQKAIEHGHFWLIDLVQMVIFHSYVSCHEPPYLLYPYHTQHLLIELLTNHTIATSQTSINR